MMKTIQHFFYRFLRDDEAPTFFEYGLLVVVIALVVVGAASAFGVSVAQFFNMAAASN